MKNLYSSIFFLICLMSLSVTKLQAQSDTAIINKHLTAITKTEGFRNYKNTTQLNKVAAYIYEEFSLTADTVFYQDYNIDGEVYRNVVCRFDSDIDQPTMIIGAHYDVCDDQEGADDNASGVVGILELTRLLKDKELSRPLEIVAYTLEEPPFFGTQNMGSAVHARSLKESGRNIFGMALIEMIGYYNDEENTQRYPIKSLASTYGTKADFIALVTNVKHGDFVKRFATQFLAARYPIRTIEAAYPPNISGIGLSDHINYWNEGFDAMMVTNTSYFRSPHYHKPSDTVETLDIERMAAVINSIYYAVLHIDD